MRGFVFRVALQWDLLRRQKTPKAFSAALDEASIFNVAPGQWTVYAIVISTIIFAAGHVVAEWPAAIAYGLLMALLWILRKDLISCIVAHGGNQYRISPLCLLLRALGVMVKSRIAIKKY